MVPSLRSDLVDDRGGGGDQVEVVLALQALLHDLHVQHAQEAAAEAEAQGLGGLRLVEQRGVVQAQLGQRVAQFLVGVRVHRVEPGEDPRLDLAEARQALLGRAVGAGDGVPHRGAVDLLDPGDEIAHLARAQALALGLLGGEDAHVVRLVGTPGGHHQDLVALLDLPLHDADQGNHADIGVEPGVDDEGLQGGIRVPHRRRDIGHQGLEQVGDALAGLGADPQGVAGVDADDLLDLGDHLVRVGGGQVDLVQNGQDLEPLIEGRVAIGHALGLDALGRVHHQQGPLAGGQRARDLVGEVHMPWGVDEVEVVDLAVARLVIQGHALGLDGDAALALQVHGVQHLGGHLPNIQAAASLDEAIGDGGLAVVNMGDDREVTDVA